MEALIIWHLFGDEDVMRVPHRHMRVARTKAHGGSCQILEIRMKLF